MMKLSGLCVLLLLFVCMLADGSPGKLMVCYYHATSYFPPSKVPADVCTHIIYASGTATTSGIQPTSSRDLQYYKELVALKQKNPKLKVLLSLAHGFPSVVDNGKAVMTRFSQAAIKNLTTFGFDGIDLDWETPSSIEKSACARFIEIFSSDLKRAKLLMSAALPNNPVSYERGFDTKCLAEHMDFMTAMTYDFHLYFRGDNTTGYNSPLETPKYESKYMSTSAMMEFYLSSGLPANKLLMGLPLYGRSWKLANPSSHGLHSPAVGKGDPGPYRHISGIYLYPDVCVALQQGATPVFDQVNGAAYLYKSTTWVAYDDPQTIKTKISWLKAHNLGGVGIWAAHLDDVTGVCNAGTLPLLSSIKLNL